GYVRMNVDHTSAKQTGNDTQTRFVLIIRTGPHRRATLITTERGPNAARYWKHRPFVVTHSIRLQTEIARFPNASCLRLITLPIIWIGTRRARDRSLAHERGSFATPPRENHRGESLWQRWPYRAEPSPIRECKRRARRGSP